MERPTAPGSAGIFREFEPGGFFVLRAAVCPVENLITPGATSDEIRSRLQRWARDPLVLAAIYLASPTLSQRLAEWQLAPTDEGFDALRPSLYRYFVRMSSRATPFGLMASFTTGHLSGAWNLDLGPREALRPCSWFDLGFIHPLVRRLVGRSDVRRNLNYTLNTTFFRHGDGWRYVEQLETEKRRERLLAKVENGGVIEAIVAACRAGDSVSLPRLCELVLHAASESDFEVDGAEAAAFVDELIDAQILVPSLLPTLTGPDPVRHVLQSSSTVPSLAAFHQEFRSVADRLAEIDRQDHATLRDSYRDLAGVLRSSFGVEGERNLFHVDLRRDVPGLTLARTVLGPIGRAVEALHRITPPSWPYAALNRFREQFADRYGDREVDLLSVLDEDSGIGFDIDPSDRRNEGLLKEFRFPDDADDAASITIEPRIRHLLRLIERATAAGCLEVALSQRDLQELSVATPRAMPDVFTVLGSLASGVNAADSSDQACFILRFVSSSARLFGRFCRADAGLNAELGALLRKEEALQPDAVFAEIVHLPEDRVGNIVCRPALRGKDLPYLGESGLRAADRIHAWDLAVSIQRQRIVLRSKSLDAEVLPRLTCAQNSSARNASVFRFLAALSLQDGASGLAFSWGPLFDEARFLPRISIGRVVLAPASWYVDPLDAQAWRKLRAGVRRQRVAEWRASASIPRWIQVGQHDNLLLLDLESDDALAALVDEVVQRGSRRIHEIIPAPDQMPVASPEGHHAHEVMLPFVRRAPAPRPPVPRAPADARGSAANELRFALGSRWLYAKVYGSPRATERALVEDLHEWISERLARGDFLRWHFVRYRDPDYHIRLRFDGDPNRLAAVACPKLEQLFRGWSDSGAIWRLQYDTYEREIERYGGPAAIEIAESIFHADSDLVAALLAAAPANAAADWRWQVSIKIIDRYLRAFGFDLAARRAQAERSERGLRAEFRVDKERQGAGKRSAGAELEVGLSERYRAARATIEGLIGEELALPGHLAWANDAVASCLERVGPLAAWYGHRAIGAVHAPIGAGIVNSFAHMHINRMMLSNPREHEMIVYAFLHRAYRSRLAQRL